MESVILEHSNNKMLYLLFGCCHPFVFRYGRLMVYEEEVYRKHPTKNEMFIGPPENQIIAEFFYDNRIKKISLTHYGRIEGMVIAWHPNGITQYITYFKNGSQDGPYHQWDENGVEIVRGEYRRGRRVGNRYTLTSQGIIVENYSRGSVIRKYTLEDGDEFEQMTKRIRYDL